MILDARVVNFEPVKSSYIDAVAYNDATRELRIQFKSGATWKYSDVPPSVHVSLLMAESTGKYFAAEIKGVFKARKIEPEDEF